jgi:hypothetical protein
MKVMVCSILCLCLLVGVIGADILDGEQFSNMTTPVYTEDATLPIATEVPTIAGSATILPVDISITGEDSTVTVQTIPDELPADNTTAVAITINTDNNASLVEKTIQVLPETKIVMSPNGQTMMKVSGGGLVEIYYGYQVDPSHPWSEYYKVDGDTATHASFSDRHVWITTTNRTEINNMIFSGEIPLWSDLP